MINITLLFLIIIMSPSKSNTSLRVHGFLLIPSSDIYLGL